MSTLVDQNEKPITNGQNGQSHGPETADVRTVPTGTLIYNLIRFTIDEIGLEGMVGHMLEAKEHHKMVADPPQLERAKEKLAQMQEARYIAAREINERLKDVDKARLDSLGIKVVAPAAPTNEPAPAATEATPEDKTS